MAGARAAATRGIPLGPMGEPAEARSVGTDGPTEPDHGGTDPSDRAGSSAVSAKTRRATAKGCVALPGLLKIHRVLEFKLACSLSPCTSRVRPG